MTKILFELNDEVNNKQIDFDLYTLFQRLTKITYKKLSLLNQPIFCVSLVSNRVIKDINNKYRNKNKVTDVISFSFKDNNLDAMILGELYICLNQAIKQAKQYQHSLKREISFLFVHGLLHILGYNHIEIKEQKIMFALQDEILNIGKITK